MKIKSRDLKLLIENLLNEAVKDPSDKRWTVIRVVLNMITQKKLPDYNDPETYKIKDWDAKDDALLLKVTGVDEVGNPDPILVGKALKDKINAIVINGKSGKEIGIYDNMMRYLESESKAEELIDKNTKGKTDAEKKKVIDDISDTDGKIIQDPKNPGYHYKKVLAKIGDGPAEESYFIISSPKDNKVSEKNATYVDPVKKKTAYDAISKLFK